MRCVRVPEDEDDDPEVFGGPRKQAPVELPVSDMVEAKCEESTSGKFIKFKNCRLVKGHQLVREDLWIRCAVFLTKLKIRIVCMALCPDSLHASQ